MNNLYFDLLERSENLCYDKKKKETIEKNIRTWRDNHLNSSEQFFDLRVAKDKLTSLRDKSLHNLNNIDIEFEKKFIENGGEVSYALSNKDVAEAILRILKENKAKNIVFNSSSLLEDLAIKETLRSKDYVVTELNIGNIVAELDSNINYNEHFTLHTISKDFKDIKKLLSNRYGIPDTADERDVINAVSEYNSKKIVSSDAFISGVNALILSTGSVVLFDNEGAMAKVQTYSPIKIFIATVDQILSNIEDLELYLPMYSSYSYGMRMISNCLVISGVSKNNKQAGASVHLIITNNNRLSVIQDSTVSSVLRCINCGACLNVCPIYKCGSGSLYNNPYVGPVGIVMTPLLKSLSKYNFLPNLCTLCGECTNICPVKIDFPSLVIELRRKIVEKGHCSSDDENLVMKLHKRFLKRKKLDRRSYRFKNRKLNRFTIPWNEWAELPKFAEKSFAQQYEKMRSKEK